MLNSLLYLSLAGSALAVPFDSKRYLSVRSNVHFNVSEAAVVSLPLHKDLISLSIEFGNTLDFFGDVGKPNNFSLQLLQNVAERARSPPILRIGGNTQDRADFCENCTDTLHRVVKNDPNDPKTTEAVSLTFNKDFFTVLIENIPFGTPLILGLNFRNNTYSIAQTELDGALKYLDQELVMAYELGNEVNLYGKLFRPEGYNAEAYAAQMNEWLPRLESRQPGDVKFQFPSFAGPPQDFDSDLTIAELVKIGLPQNISGIEYMSLHGYPYNICNVTDAAKVNLTNFLDHKKTIHLVHQYSEEISASKSLGKEVHMGETGSVACHGKDGVSNTLGAALWELDYALSGAAAGMDRFFFHMGQGDFFYSMWEPVGTEANPGPHIFPTYYAMLFMADVVGDLCDATIAALPNLDTSSAVHFAVYEKGELKKLILLNTQEYNGGSERPGVDFDVSSILGPAAKVRRLTGPQSDARTGLTWAGQSVNSEGKIEGSRDVERVEDGIVTLLASEAVVVVKQ